MTRLNPEISRFRSLSLPLFVLCPITLNLSINALALQLTCHRVAWNWGGGAPEGEVVDKKEEGDVSITSKRGNTIKKNAEPENPAIHVGRSGNDVVKKASELEVVEEGAKGKGKSKSPAPPKKKKGKEEGKEEGKTEEENAANGKKREHEEASGEEPKADAKPKKATKAAKGDTPSSAANGELKKGRGRPKKSDSEAKPKKAPKPRATEGIGSRTRSRA